MPYPWMTLAAVLVLGISVIVWAWRHQSPKLATKSVKPPVPVRSETSQETASLLDQGETITARLAIPNLSLDADGRHISTDAQVIVVAAKIDTERLAWPLLLQAKAAKKPLAIIAEDWDELLLGTISANTNQGTADITPLIGAAELADTLGIDKTSIQDLHAGYLPKPLQVALLAASKDSCIIVRTKTSLETEANPTTND